MLLMRGKGHVYQRRRHLNQFVVQEPIHQCRFARIIQTWRTWWCDCLPITRMVTSLEYNPRYCRKEYTREEKELPIRKKCEWMEFTRQELRRMGWKEWDEGNGDADGIDYLISLVNGPWKRVMLRLVIEGDDCLLMMQYMFWNRWFSGQALLLARKELESGDDDNDMKRMCSVLHPFDSILV